MQYRRLGRCGLKLSELSLGAGNWGYKAMDEKMIGETVALALDAGINYFDNAQSYTNGLAEEIMGRLFRRLNLRRVSYVVSTKYFWGISDGPNERDTLNRKYLIDGVNGSLKRLQMDYVDIVYCHRNDPNTPSRRPSGPCTTSSSPARRCTGVRPNGAPMKSAPRGKSLSATTCTSQWSNSRVQPTAPQAGSIRNMHDCSPTLVSALSFSAHWQAAH